MIEAFYMTIELWVFLGVLLTALVFEAIITTYTTQWSETL
jgi:hypothetical protein